MGVFELSMEMAGQDLMLRVVVKKGARARVKSFKLALLSKFGIAYMNRDPQIIHKKYCKVHEVCRMLRWPSQPMGR